MARKVLKITCSGCGIIRHADPELVSPFEHHKLRCSRCGARNPTVTEDTVRAPFECGYQSDVSYLDEFRNRK